MANAKPISEKFAELVPVRAAIQRDGNPQHVHHRKTGEEQAIEHRAVGFLDDTLGAFRIVGYGSVADPGERTNHVGQLAAPVVPAQVQPPGGQVDVGRLHAGHALQAALDQPHAGGAVDALNEQVNVAYIAGAGGEFLLHFVEVVDFDVFGRLRRRTEQCAFRSALVIALQPGFKNGTAYRLAAEAAKLPLYPIKTRAITRLGGDGQTTMEAVVAQGAGVRGPASS